MKILCPSCDRLAELGGYRLDAGVLIVTCARCGAELRAVDAPPNAPEPPPPSAPPRVVALRAVGEDPAVIAARAAQAEDPFAAPPGHCPKCVAPRTGGELSCLQCGLTFVNFRREDVVPPPPLDGLWRELLASWDDSAAHERLLAAAVTQAALPSIARLYQIRIAQSPDDLHARRGRDEVLRLATASATAFGRTPPPDPARGARVAAYVVAGVVLFILTVVLVRQLATLGSP